MTVSPILTSGCIIIFLKIKLKNQNMRLWGVAFCLSSFHRTMKRHREDGDPTGPYEKEKGVLLKKSCSPTLTPDYLRTGKNASPMTQEYGKEQDVTVEGLSICNAMV